MKNKNLLFVASLVVTGFLAARPAAAQPIVLSGTNYSQNFDSLSSGLPQAWNTYSTATSTTQGNIAVYHSSPTNWSQTSALFWNMASLTNSDGSAVPTNSTTAQQSNVLNRVIGIRQTGTANTGGDPGASIAVELNDTTIGSSFNVSFDWLQLADATRTTVWELDYGLGSTPSLYTKIAQWTNGGQLPSQIVTNYIGVTNLSFSFGSALDNQNQNVWIRIAALNATTGSGSRCGFGFDNFNLTWSPPVLVTNPIVITAQPQNTTNNAEDTASLSVSVTGTAPVYQWYEVVGGVTNQVFDNDNGDNSQIAGADGPALQITGVLGAEAGSYFCTISNSVNSTNSALATLTVNDPYISGQPGNQTNVAGDIDYFDATEVGSLPTIIYWYYNGTVLQTNFGNAVNTNQVFVYVTNSAAWINTNGFYMVASNTYGIVTSAVVTASIPAVSPVLITRWDFNETNNYPVSAPGASIGTGTGSEVTAGGIYTNFLFPSGAIADPIDLDPDFVNSGWEFQDGPTNGTANKQVGFQYNTSTVGYNQIFLTWEERHSATASKYMRVQYSPDGVNFFDGPVITLGEVAYDFCSANLSGYPGVNNNPNFAFRIVDEFESTAIGSTNASYDGTTSTYGAGAGGGTIRNDLMTVWGSPMLHISLLGTNAYVTWPSAQFSLQASTNLTGPYTNVSSSPAGPSYTAPLGKQMFFRLTN